MVSFKQLQANRANAKLSSGPKSARGKRAVALNAIKHGLSMPLALALPEAEHGQALLSIADLIAPECNNLEAARHIASNILEYERNESAQLDYFISCCLKPQGLPSGAVLEEAVRQRYPEYDMLQDSIDEELMLKSRPSKRWILGCMKIMERMRLEFVKSIQREQARAFKRWIASRRYLKRAANQLTKSLRSNVRSMP